MNICEQCGYHLKMSSSDRIKLLIDPGTWDPVDEDMVSLKRRIQRKEWFGTKKWGRTKFVFSCM